MRIKIGELMEANHLETAYQLAAFSNGRISTRTASRLVRAGGQVKQFNGELLAALYDVFGLTSWDRLIER